MSKDSDQTTCMIILPNDSVMWVVLSGFIGVIFLRGLEVYIRIYIELISFIFLPESSFVCTATYTIFIATYTVHLNRVYDKAKFYTGGWVKPILIYHMIDRLSRIIKFDDRQKVKDNI